MDPAWDVGPQTEPTASLNEHVMLAVSAEVLSFGSFCSIMQLYKSGIYIFVAPCTVFGVVHFLCVRFSYVPFEWETYFIQNQHELHSLSGF